MMINALSVLFITVVGLISWQSAAQEKSSSNTLSANSLTPSPKKPNVPGIPPEQRPENSQNDTQLLALIDNLNLTAIDIDTLDLPSITSTKAQLGKKLFFTKNLGGEQSVACVSCHHPNLGGGDALSLPVGINPVNINGEVHEDILGHGRFNGNDENNLPSVPRNSPTIFNLGLMTTSLFWDGRIERNIDGEILTPESSLDINNTRIPDDTLPEGATLAMAQARFPVTSIDEMRGSFASQENNQLLREQLASRFDNSDPLFVNSWLSEITAVFNQASINFDMLAEAISEYERSMVFVNSPWQNYLSGDLSALTNKQKSGAILFFSLPSEGGAGCMFCHNGPTFSDNRHHLVGFPQIGPGSGNDSSTQTSQDFGRENITHNEADRFHFKTPSLLNISSTAPYGHSGAYQTLTEVVSHYNNPLTQVRKFFGAKNNQENIISPNSPFCQLPQVLLLIEKTSQTCSQLYPDALENSIHIGEHLELAQQNTNIASSVLLGGAGLTRQEIAQLVAFLEALTDPCVLDKECLAPWLLNEEEIISFPDNNPLIAIDAQGERL